MQQKLEGRKTKQETAPQQMRRTILKGLVSLQRGVLQPFSQGLPGSMESVLTPTRLNHSRTALAVNSEPLSDRI